VALFICPLLLIHRYDCSVAFYTISALGDVVVSEP